MVEKGEIELIFSEELQWIQDEKLKKTTRCPKCQTKITCEGTPGEKTHVTCPNCGNKGIVTFEKTNPIKQLITFKKR